MKNKAFSNRIANINFYLTLLVVLIHCNCSLYITGKVGNMDYLFKLIELITSIAVPTFFAISSYLFFKNYDLSKTKGKFKTRIKSLLIPYLLWSTIFLLFVIFLDKINILHGTDNIIGNIDYSFVSIVNNIINSNFDGPLWYVKALMILIVLSPIFYILITKLKKINLFIIPIFLIINVIFDVDYPTFIYWIFVYYLVAYLTITYGDISKILKKINKYDSIVFILYGLLLIINVINFKNYILLLIYRIFSILFVISLQNRSKSMEKNPNKYAKYSFFIFCIHNWICVIVKRILIMIFGSSPISCFIIQFPTWVIALTIIILIIKLMDKICPRILCILNGGRNEG